MFSESEGAMMVVALIGAFTAVFAATMGLAANDIKRVMAYSTVSQLGYMMAALGIGAYTLRCSTCSPTHSSKRCCSSARVASITLPAPST